MHGNTEKGRQQGDGDARPAGADKAHDAPQKQHGKKDKHEELPEKDRAAVRRLPLHKPPPPALQDSPAGAGSKRVFELRRYFGTLPPSRALGALSATTCRIGGMSTAASAPADAPRRPARKTVMAELKYRRVLLKLSGEALAGELKTGINPDTVAAICTEIGGLLDLGVQLALVIGGGNIFRGLSGSAKGMERSSADYMGMLATVLNALAVQDMLEKQGYPTRVLSAITMQEVCEPFIRRRALRHLEKGRVVICAAGTGNPYFTTDTTAALRGMELQCDAVIKATKVDGIYDKDPAVHDDAVKYDSLTYDETLNRRIGVMDAAAFALMRDNNVPIIVCRMFGGYIRRVLLGEAVGTIVHK